MCNDALKTPQEDHSWNFERQEGYNSKGITSTISKYKHKWHSHIQILVAFLFGQPLVPNLKGLCLIRSSGSQGRIGPVGQFRWIPKGPAARREKFHESMETFAFLSISAH